MPASWRLTDETSRYRARTKILVAKNKFDTGTQNGTGPLRNLALLPTRNCDD